MLTPKVGQAVYRPFGSCRRTIKKLSLQTATELWPLAKMDFFIGKMSCQKDGLKSCDFVRCYKNVVDG